MINDTGLYNIMHHARTYFLVHPFFIFLSSYLSLFHAFSRSFSLSFFTLCHVRKKQKEYKCRYASQLTTAFGIMFHSIKNYLYHNKTPAHPSVCYFTSPNLRNLPLFILLFHVDLVHVLFDTKDASRGSGRFWP